MTGWTPPPLAIQWLADDVDITGATGSGYTLTSAEQGQTVKVTVSFTDDAGNGEIRTSAATAAVVALPVPGEPPKLAEKPRRRGSS